MATLYLYLVTLGISLNVLRVHSDDIDVGARKGAMLKYLREMVNQTKVDTLNLPANATSIRENITDNFSCENRTYGYYADVDNECQLFHVCLPSQTTSGRHTTYRWSFICPYETVFNQEVLTCARPRDSIDCQDSPMYYDVNMDIGKINDTSKNDGPKNKYEQQPIKMETRKKPNRKKNNLVVENIRELINKELSKENLQTLLKEEDEFVPNVEETLKFEEIKDMGKHPEEFQRKEVQERETEKQGNFEVNRREKKKPIKRIKKVRILRME